MKKSRYPKSIHAQTEAILHEVRAIGRKKKQDAKGIRSIGTWRAYRREFHRFAKYLENRDCQDLRDTQSVKQLMHDYLQELLNDYQRSHRSHQTFKRILTAMAKFVYARNTFLHEHGFVVESLICEELFRELSKESRKKLAKSSRAYDNRAYPYVKSLIQEIADPTHRLQAQLQLEGGTPH